MYKDVGFSFYELNYFENFFNKLLCGVARGGGEGAPDGPPWRFQKIVFFFLLQQGITKV